jgi:7-cyano-7-deazaguanine synthase
MKKCIVLLSGGLDSATALYYARKQGYECMCLVFDYGQRHRKEINAAKSVARAAGCPLTVIRFKLPWKGSVLLDRKIRLPEAGPFPKGNGDIPATYVPGRNIIFLSFALSFAEATGASSIFIGANAVDFSGYPDCRPEFYDAFRKVVVLGTAAGVKGSTPVIKTPLINKTKGQIVKLGLNLRVPFELTWSCYSGGKFPCGKCDSCMYRAKGFREAGVKDPLGRL